MCQGTSEGDTGKVKESWRGGGVEVCQGISEGDTGKVLRVSRQDRTLSNGFKTSNVRFKRQSGTNRLSNKAFTG